MSNRIAVVGVGAVGSVLAAALLRQRPDTVLVAQRGEVRSKLLRDGIKSSGVLAYEEPVRHAVASVGDLKGLGVDAVFLCTKTYSLPQVLEELAAVYTPGMKVVSTHNGLGTEDAIAKKLGADAALRMVLNYGAAVKGTAEVEVAFFNKPNPLGSVTPEGRAAAVELAEVLTAGGLDTQVVDDFRLYVWKKMVMKCTMASICAVTDRTIKGALEFPPTRQIAEMCFQEVLAVAKAMGYDLGEGYLTQILAYMETIGVHKDSMCHDIAARRPTEIDFLGAKVVQYGQEKGVPTPGYSVMTNLVRALEDSYLSAKTKGDAA